MFYQYIAPHIDTIRIIAAVLVLPLIAYVVKDARGDQK